MSTDPWHPGHPRPEVLDRAQAALTRHGHAGGLPRVGDGIERTISLVDAYAELVAVAMARAAFYGELLAVQFTAARAEPRDADDAADTPWDDAPGSPVGLGGDELTGGLIGYTYTAATVSEGRDQTRVERTATGEQVRALVNLEAAERDRAAKLIRDALRIGLDLQKIEVMRGYAATTAAALRALIAELGLSFNDEPVLRAAKRAGLAARRAVGADDGDPDVAVGPALTAAERDRVLTAALSR